MHVLTAAIGWEYIGHVLESGGPRIQMGKASLLGILGSVLHKYLRQVRLPAFINT